MVLQVQAQGQELETGEPHKTITPPTIFRTRSSCFTIKGEKPFFSLNQFDDFLQYADNSQYVSILKEISDILVVYFGQVNISSRLITNLNDPNKSSCHEQYRIQHRLSGLSSRPFSWRMAVTDSDSDIVLQCKF